ncbi:MAG: hypothetical protein M1840_006363 [Geoglossum simile]|nr:MAG: hypothetical protein M1840_006363 [Geoglossum simile]
MRDIHGELKRSARNLENEKRKRFLKWLDPYTPSQACYERAKRVNSPETFSWIFNSTEFARWLESSAAVSSSFHNTKVLEITGPEACGKSTAAAALVRQLPLLIPNANSMLCTVFRDENYNDSEFTHKIVPSILVQIFNQNPKLITTQIIDSYYDSSTRSASIDVYREIFKELAPQCNRLFVLLDNVTAWQVELAVKQLLGSLHQAAIVQQSTREHHSLRIIWFHRLSPYDEKFSLWTEILHLELTEEIVKKDMSTFVRLSAQKISQSQPTAEELTKLATEIEEVLLNGPTE